MKKELTFDEFLRFFRYDFSDLKLVRKDGLFCVTASENRSSCYYKNETDAIYDFIDKFSIIHPIC